MVFIIYNGIGAFNWNIISWHFFQLWKQKLSVYLVSFYSKGTKVMGWIYKYQTEDFKVLFFMSLFSSGFF